MKHLIIIILVFLFTSFLHSQVVIYDSLYLDSCLETSLSFKKKHVICYDRFHKLTRQGILIDGKREGEWKLYMDGELLKCGSYKNNQKKGTWKEFYLNGKEIFIGKYKNDLETGIWRVYLNDKDLRLSNDDNKKRLVEIRKYKNGKFLEKKIFDMEGKCVGIEKY